MTMTEALIDLMRKQWVTPQVALERVGCFSLAQRVSRDIAPAYTVQKDWMHRPNGRPVRMYRIVESK